jgi:hypothetical protein
MKKRKRGKPSEAGNKGENSALGCFKQWQVAERVAERYDSR